MTAPCSPEFMPFFITFCTGFLIGSAVCAAFVMEKNADTEMYPAADPPTDQDVFQADAMGRVLIFNMKTGGKRFVKDKPGQIHELNRHEVVWHVPGLTAHDVEVKQS